MRDGPLAAVRAELARFPAETLLLDQRVVHDYAIRLRVGETWEGTLSVQGREIDLGDVSAAYFRPYDSRRMGHAARDGAGSAAWQHAIDFDDSLWTWAELSPVRVVNRASAMAGNASKPHQATAIRSLGFHVPETIVTTDADEAVQFFGRHRQVVYKSVSSERSIVSRLNDRDLERLDALQYCPTQFQEWVPGVEHRVHVIGDEVFCTRIVSDADDYRYAGRYGISVDMQSVSLPSDIAEKCQAAARMQGLAVAGIDLRLAPGGRWYCFEVNPSPAFTYFDEQGRIARAIARLLAGERVSAMAVLSDREIAEVARSGGFSGEGLITAVAVALAESGGDTSARGFNGPTAGCADGSVDRGLWQINDCYHPNVTDECAFDPHCCARAAFRISDGGAAWGPWSTYNNGAYSSFLARARAAVGAPTHPPWPGVYLSLGSAGVTVETMQRQLVNRGWTLDVDRHFGKVTDRVVRAFQNEKGLASDGIVGPKTWDCFWTCPITFGGQARRGVPASVGHRLPNR